LDLHVSQINAVCDGDPTQWTHTYLREALRLGDSIFEKTRKAFIWLDIALAEAKLKHTEQAVEAAEMVKTLVEPDSATALQATSTIIQLTLKEPQKTEKLREIERKARKAAHETIANNIAIDLSHGSENPEKEISHLDRVLQSAEQMYNYYRAVVAKAMAVNNLANPDGALGAHACGRRPTFSDSGNSQPVQGCAKLCEAPGRGEGEVGKDR
jgi:hypothetical protein